MSFARDGFEILSGVLSEDGCRSMVREIDLVFESVSAGAIRSGDTRVGGRNLIDHWSAWRKITDHAKVASMIREHVGSKAGLVRILYFDKPPGRGWSLSLHRDKTIAVAEHHEPLGPFSKPTRKAGVPHVEAHDELLSKMLTLRLHLDPMTKENGAIFVVPGSHVSAETDDAGIVSIHCNAGDVFMMRPLLLHGSHAAAAETQQHRRVVHLEIAPHPDLPAPYDWHSFEPIVSSQGDAKLYEGS